jgi:hypothetical protein
MGAFEDLLSEGMPEPEVHIHLPGKVGNVDKGGDAAQASSPAGRAADSQTASTAPEPEPQLPEGSDPDEPDDLDTAEEDAADAAAAGAAAFEMFRAEAAQAEDGPGGIADEPVEDETAEDEGSAASPQAPMRPMAYKKGSGFSFDGEHSQLKHFPKALIETLRELLQPHLGEPFARDLSQNSLVTAFVVAALGVQFTADENTLQAVEAFRANDPRIEAIEKRTVQLLERQSTSEGMLKAILGRLGDVADTAAVLEMGQAYALAERTAQLDTSAALPETLDVTQKRVVAARDNIRTRVKAHQKDEKIRAGRPIR